MTRTLLCSIQLKQPLHQREYQRLALLPSCAALRPPCTTLGLQRFGKYACHLLPALQLCAAVCTQTPRACIKHLVIQLGRSKGQLKLVNQPHNVAF